MPAEGLSWIPSSHLPTLKDYARLFQLFQQWEIKKIRFTGGEPLIRKDFMEIVSLAKQAQIPEMALTTNGVLVLPYLESLKENGIRKINFSLDTLSPSRFLKITRRDHFDDVIKAIDAALKLEYHVSVNAVLLSDTEEKEIHEFMDWALKKNLHLRFIEEMPFNGQGIPPDWHWNWRRVESCILKHLPEAKMALKTPGSTADHYHIPSSQGSIGIIAAFSRTFCGTCNRLRLTPEGHLHHCLYSDQSYPLIEKIRSDLSDESITQEVAQFVMKKAINGFEAEKENQDAYASMAQIGG
jgi:cyclic pyranopterin phosphate synthase